MKKALTLVEVLVAIGIVSLITLSMFMLFPTIFEKITISGRTMGAFEIAKKELDRLKAYNFSELYNASYANGSPAVGYNFTIDNFPNSSGVYYVKKMYDLNNTVLVDLLDLEVVVCFRVGSRTIGEDKNLNAILDSGEDVEVADGKISSTVKLHTLIFKQ